MWTDIRQEIEQVRKMLQLTPEQFRAVGAAEWPRIERQVETAFREPVAPTQRRPLLWTQLRAVLPQAHLADSGSNATLPQLQMPWAGEALVFFFAKEDLTDPKIWWYRTTGAVAWQLLEYWWQKPRLVQEWGFVDANYHWALFVTHSDDIIFCGEPLVSNVRRLGPQSGVKIQ